jgi:hypothetical protein
MNQRIYVIRCRRPRVAREKSQLIRPYLDEHTTSLLLSIVTKRLFDTREASTYEAN